MSTFTPGPWKLRQSVPMDIRGNIHQVTGGLYPTAFVPAWNSPAPGEEDGTEEALANARLVAAAPDLLAALRKSKQHIEQLAASVNALSPKKVRASDFTEVVDAAIAIPGQSSLRMRSVRSSSPSRVTTEDCRASLPISMALASI